MSFTQVVSSMSKLPYTNFQYPAAVEMEMSGCDPPSDKRRPSRARVRATACRRNAKAPVRPARRKSPPIKDSMGNLHLDGQIRRWIAAQVELPLPADSRLAGDIKTPVRLQTSLKIFALKRRRTTAGDGKF